MKKDRSKVVRTILEILFLTAFLILVIKNLFVFSEYEPFGEGDVVKENGEEENGAQEDTGFIAVSYFGIARDATETLVSAESLDEQLQALKDNGYVTISQQDILDYYSKGKTLPEKSLFLMFEDGRKDTVVFAEKITEKMNDRSTILTYADKFENGDAAFLQPHDLETLRKNTYWEFGTNGYRLQYINVYDRKEEFLGELDSRQYGEIHEALGRDYDHYLMDYLRDEYRIPTETQRQMEHRITLDYDRMHNIYTERTEKMPMLYVLMHSNTGQFGENRNVSVVNEKNIKKYFKMNFNREGYSFNDRESSVYDLTRIEPQPYWHTNHLLTRIRDDTGQKVNFVVGDERRAKNFDAISGVAEYEKDEIALTCESESVGTLRLKDSKEFENISISTELLGNALGAQTIYLRADENLKKYLKISIENEILKVDTEKGSICQIPVSEPAENSSVDMKEGKGKSEEKAELELNKKADYKLQIVLDGNKLSLWVNGTAAIEQQKIEEIADKGEVYLQAGWGGNSYSQRNLSDDIYDGVFKNLKITEYTGEKNENILYDNTLHGMEKIMDSAERIWRKTVNFFIETF